MASESKRMHSNQFAGQLDQVVGQTGLRQGDRVIFLLDDDGHVELKVARYSIVASLAGAAGTLRHPRTMEEILEVARDEALADEYRSV